MKGAAIDLGSNSFICYIYEFNDDCFKTLEDKIILTRLSEGVEETKKISNSALKRAEQAFKVFSGLCLKHGVGSIQAIATSAARDAENKSEFIELAKKFSIPVQIISGTEEANLTFLGVKNYFKETKGYIIDIGGGSTEFIYAAESDVVDRVSLNVGVVRFTERYLKHSDFVTQEKSIRFAIRKEFQNNSQLAKMKNKESKIFLAVSGTPTSASALKLNGFKFEKIENTDLSSQDLMLLLELYGSLDLDQRLEKFPFIESRRADVLPTGLLILDEALKFFGFSSYKISTRGIRHGLASNMCNSISML